MKFFRLAPLALIAALLAAGCANTVRGVGQDVENTAEATERAVEDVAD
ncbi:MAG TPA: EncA/B family entericidin [Mesorhizobium sp.]|jgi:predicted small secreted protein|nr:EncA/B family entericidin [Mesorhizobium sp.]